jgi:predicted RecB family nuclease
MHIDLLYGVSRKTRDHMRQAGILTLAHVITRTVDELQQVKGIGPVTAPSILANAQAWLENRPVWREPLPETCRLPGWMFDLETLESGGRTIPWCLGWCDANGTTHIALVAPVQYPETLILPDEQAVTLVPDSDTVWEVFAESVADTAGPLYHWTGYDAGILAATGPEHVKAVLGPRLHDLHKTFKTAVSLPLKSTSIKPVSAYLGYAWPGYQDWFAALLDYRHWLDTGDADVLARACMYQRADVQSMAHVWRWLNGHNQSSGK